MSEDDVENEEDEEDEDEEDEDMDEIYAESRFPAGFPTHVDVPVVPLRELPAGVGVYVRSLGERAAPPSSWSRAVTTFYGPLFLAVTCLMLVSPVEYNTWTFLGGDFQMVAVFSSLLGSTAVA